MGLISKNIASMFPSVFYYLWITLELSGHGVPWFVACFYLMFAYPTLQTVAWKCIFALVIDLLVVGVIKVTFKRQRPDYNKGKMFATVSVDKFSFPSGHTTRAVLMATFIIKHINTIAHPLATNFILGWAFLIALSRVALGRHHVSDVICGALIGYLQYDLAIYMWIESNLVQFIS